MGTVLVKDKRIQHATGSGKTFRKLPPKSRSLRSLSGPGSIVFFGVAGIIMIGAVNVGGLVSA
jgi:hypothetical protein